jgi:hypothetical protein
MKTLLKFFSYGALGVLVLILITATLLEKLFGSSIVLQYLYTSPWIIMLWAILALSAISYIVMSRMKILSFTFLIHFAFALILAGALVTHIFGRQGRMHLFENSPPKSNYISYDGRVKELPFKVSLNSFTLKYYRGTFAPMDYVSSITIDDGKYKGAAYIRKLDEMIREARFSPRDGQSSADAASIMWYLWLSEDSPLFGKDKMTTFERYFIEDKATHKENKVPYYRLMDKEEMADKILEDFGLDPKKGKILNGHVPVKLKDGEKPVKAGGKLYVIDGGISKAYQKTTGIAGYTAIMTSKHMYLAEHKPYEPLREDGTQVFHRPVMHLEDTVPERIRIRDTDTGAELREQIASLEELLYAFKSGSIKETY